MDIFARQATTTQPAAQQPTTQQFAAAQTARAKNATADTALGASGAKPFADARDRNALLRTRAQELETAFLAEMLSYTGLDQQGQGFGGGIGADQFASFLRQEQAAMIVARGGIGLAEQLFRAMGGQDDA